MPAASNLVEGVLEIHPRGHGFLRNSARNYRIEPADPYVSNALIERFALRAGMKVAGPVEPPGTGQAPRLASVNGLEDGALTAGISARFDELTAIDPTERIILETGREPLTMRIMDLLTPIGRGQRGLIVAPPRTGKTVLLEQIAQAVAMNHPDIHLCVLLIDERPEEVTQLRRSVKGEVIASNNDLDWQSHTRTAELVIERGKRLVERGRHVLVLLDSLTRLARAYNKDSSTSGRTMTGGIDVRALEVPKRLFGAARALRDAGSLTIIGTALIETGSRMDDIIFQEFKGTGNMELVLDRRLAERRIYPAMDISQSGTRKEERILPPEILERVTLLRRSMVALNPVSAMESLVKKLAEYSSNQEFLDKIGTFVRRG